MFKKTTTRLLAIGLALGLSLTGLTACDAPEQAEAPLAEAPEAPGEQVQIGEPEDPPAQPGQAEAPERPAPGEAPGAPGEAPGEAPQMAQPGEQPAMDEVDDSTLDEFAEAFVEVQKVQGELQAELQAVESPEEAQAVQQEVVATIQEKVEATGMGFQEYMMLAQRLERDPELQQRLEQRMQ